VPNDPVPHSEDLTDFLRREAPSEFARLQSIAQVVKSGPVPAMHGRDQDACPHEARLRVTFRNFDSPPDVESAA